MQILFGLTSENVTRHSFFDGLVVLMFSIMFGIKLWIQFINSVDSIQHHLRTNMCFTL